MDYTCQPPTINVGVPKENHKYFIDRRSLKASLFFVIYIKNF